MNNKNNYKHVLITGATSGIGYELSKLFAKAGFNLVLVARNQMQLAEVAAELSSTYLVETTIIAKDLSTSSSSVEIYQELQQRDIHIDILVNNAGFSEYGEFSKSSLDRELQMMQVNMVSLTHLTKLLLPGMLQNKYGKILNLASIASFGPGPLNAVYCASKAYVLSFSEAIAEELKNTNVTVTALCPGPTDTRFAKRANIENVKLFQGKIMQPQKVAEIGFHALMNGKRSVIAGCLNKLLVYSSPFMPRTLIASMAKNMMSIK